LEARREGKCTDGLVGNMKERDHLNDLDENGKIILK
jgi:hypothetical protein